MSFRERHPSFRETPPDNALLWAMVRDEHARAWNANDSRGPTSVVCGLVSGPGETDNGQCWSEEIFSEMLP